MQTGLEKEFLDLLNQNIGIVHRVCLIYFRNDPALREDTRQEIIYQLWKSYPNFRSQSKFSTWMYKVSLNTALAALREKKRIPDSEPWQIRYDNIPDHPLPTDEIGLLYDAIASLSAIDKALILLYLEENTYDEISGIVGLSKTNVSVRLVRIKRELEKKLKKNN